MPRIELTTEIRAEPDAVFDACLDVDAHTRSMGGSDERAVAGVTSGGLKDGDTVTWAARHFGVRWRMTVRITDYERPWRFVDEQVSGPFLGWRHEHTFTPYPGEPSRTTMRDSIDFGIPLRFGGAPVARVILRPYLRRLVQRRNAFLAAATEAAP